MPEPGAKPVAVAVVGGGAAGLFAALSAAHALQAEGAAGSGQVVLLEGGSRVGRKLLTTGNGQCNLSHLPLSLTSYHGRQPSFATPALTQITAEKTIERFQSIGLPVTVDEAGRVYPWSRQANAVLDLLRAAIARLGVVERTQTRVTDLVLDKPRKIAHGRAGSGESALDKPLWTLVCADGQKLAAAAVIIATGGLAAPALGCGDPYALLLQHGHRLNQPFPALTRIVLETGPSRALTGIRCDGRLSICREDAILATECGEILFADYGLSGPPVLAVSRVVSAQQNPARLSAQIDFVPEWLEAKVVTWLDERRHATPELPAAEWLHGLLHKKISTVLIRASGLADRVTVSNCTEEDSRLLARQVKAWVLPIRGVRGWPDAQVTAGGISTADFDPQTMASLLRPSLYAAGEVLDIDADCGGFNLQWAWSSGWLAGREAVLHTVGNKVHPSRRLRR